MGKVIAGDYRGANITYNFTYFSINNLLRGINVRVDRNTLAEIDFLNSESQVSGSSAMLRAAFGGLAYAMSAKKAYEYVVAIRLTNGTKCLCSLNSKEYKKFLSWQFDNQLEEERREEQEQEEAERYQDVEITDIKPGAAPWSMEKKPGSLFRRIILTLLKVIGWIIVGVICFVILVLLIHQFAGK